MGENAVVVECLTWLNRNGWHGWRNNSTGVYDKERGSYRKPPPFCISGVSDIIAMKDGITYFIECKAGLGRQSADQVLFQKQCEKHGVPYVVVWSLEELKTWLLNGQAGSR